MKRKITKLVIWIVLSGAFLGCSGAKVNKEGDYSLLRGLNYAETGDYEKSMSEYFKSYEINPKNVVLLKELGYSYYLFKDTDKSLKYWLEALKIAKDDSELIKNIATLYYEREEFEKALDFMNKNYRLKDSYYQKLMGLIKYRQGEVSESYKYLSTLSPQDFDTKSALTYMDVLVKNGEEEFLQKGGKLYPYLKNDREFILKYTDILENSLSLNKESEKVLVKYMVENGLDEEVLLRLSNIYLKEGNLEKYRDTQEMIDIRY